MRTCMLFRELRLTDRSGAMARGIANGSRGALSAKFTQEGANEQLQEEKLTNLSKSRTEVTRRVVSAQQSKNSLRTVDEQSKSEACCLLVASHKSQVALGSRVCERNSTRRHSDTLRRAHLGPRNSSAVLLWPGSRAGREFGLK